MASPTPPKALSLEIIIGGRGSGQHDGYWRLLQYDIVYRPKDLRALIKLCSLKVNTRSATSMSKCLLRADQGFLNYQRYNLAELENLVSDRGLQPSPRHGGKEYLVKFLDRSDARLVFNKFLDFPPELRNRIYEFYVAGFAEEPLIMPTLPPLARVNKQLHHEVRPVFFNNCLFRMDLNYNSKTVYRSGVRPWARPWVQGKDPLRMTMPTQLFFTQLDPDLLALIQRLEISVSFFDLVSRCDKIILTIDLSAGASGTSIEARCCEESDRAHGLRNEATDRDDFLSKVKAEVAQCVSVIIDRGEGKTKLELEDVYALRGSIEKAVSVSEEDS